MLFICVRQENVSSLENRHKYIWLHHFTSPTLKALPRKKTTLIHFEFKYPSRRNLSSFFSFFHLKEKISHTLLSDIIFIVGAVKENKYWERILWNDQNANVKNESVISSLFSWLIFSSTSAKNLRPEQFVLYLFSFFRAFSVVPSNKKSSIDHAQKTNNAWFSEWIEIVASTADLK